MANPLNGDVSFKSEGKTFILRYSSDAVVQLENELDRGVIEIASEMAAWGKNPLKIRFGFIRSVFWAGLQDRQPERFADGSVNPDGIDIKMAGDLMLAAGGVMPVMNMISQAMQRAFPQPETKGARPPNRKARRKEAAGIGSNS